MAYRILYLVRHGQYERNDPEELLTSLGVAQANLAGDRLAHQPIQTIYHSDMPRAVQTAELIASRFPNAPRRSAKLLRECIPYLPPEFKQWFRARPVDDLVFNPEDVPDEMEAWMGLWSPAIPFEEIERGSTQAQRAFSHFFKPVSGADEHIVLVSHGNLIRYLICRALGVGPDAWLHMDINHCGISEVRVRPAGDCIIICHNDTGHLNGTMCTFN